MAKKTPVQIVRERFGSKEKLVGELVGTLERPEGESDEDFKARLLRVTNAQLLRLHAVETRVREQFGSKEKLADAVYAQRRKGKADKDFRARLSGLRNAQLLDKFLAAAGKVAPGAAAKKSGAAAAKS
ncbi:MAG: hypothetical protein HYY84_20865 [Deltaproteobacteria bacterium]|nr:hypothetical protein [Deltaproteobacteria bacterium]